MTIRRQLLLVCVGVGLVGVQASAVNVLVLSSGSTGHDDHVRTTLQSFGHVVTVGPEYINFDGSYSLSGFDVVYLLANYNWAFGDMPTSGQTALLDWISAGGGLVTAEWTTWKAGALFQLTQLSTAFPVSPQISYGYQTLMTFTQVTSDPLLTAGLPAQFQCPVTDIGGGTNTLLVARSGATVFYTGDAFAGQPTVVGGEFGAGRVLVFSTTNGPDQIGDANFARLLSNAMDWAGQGGACYADCDTSTGPRVLDIFDFLCFGNRFAAGDPYACDCDQSTGPGACDIFDFLCFGNAFSAGC